jgi:hypothetical protein
MKLQIHFSLFASPSMAEWRKAVGSICFYGRYFLISAAAAAKDTCRRFLFAEDFLFLYRPIF